jgi:hypothetical protein
MSIHFDSGDADGVDYFEKSSPTITAMPFTFACWVKPDSIGDHDGLVVLGISGSAYDHHALNLRSSALLEAAIRDQSSGYDNSYISPYDTGWNHCVGVFASTTSLTAYLNGVAGTEKTDVTSASGMNELRMGQYAGSWSRPLDGLLAEVGIWNVALTAGEISQLADGYTALSVRPESLESYYPMVRDYNDVMGNNTITPNNTVIYDVHPRIIEDVPTSYRSAWGGI